MGAKPLDNIHKHPIAPGGANEPFGADCISDVYPFSSAQNELVDKPVSPVRKPIIAEAFPIIDPASLPPVDWIYEGLLPRGIVTVTVGGGGMGKSTIVTAETLALVTGRPLLGKALKAPQNVWVYNLEDGKNRLLTQFYAAMSHYNVKPEEVAQNLMLNSGLDTPLKLAHTSKQGALIDDDVCAEMVASIRANEIDVLVIDPFVSSHSVNENDNNEIDLVVKQWAKIAHDEQIAVHIVHHVKKGTGNTAVTTESARGAKALTDAARSVRVLNQMTEDDAEKSDVSNRLDFVSGHIDKGNLAPSAAYSDWFQLLSVKAANGEWVGVAVPWTWQGTEFDDLTPQVVRKLQDAVEGHKCRKSNQSKDWVGNVIAPILELDPSDSEQKKALSKKIDHLLKRRLFVSYQAEDSQRRKRDFIKVGERQTLKTEVFE